MKHSLAHAPQDAGDRGFTLLELLVVIGIICAMTAVSVPPFLGAVAHAKLRGGSSSLAGLLQGSRIEAIKRNQTITVHFTTTANVPFAFAENATDASPDLPTARAQVQLGGSTLQMTIPDATPALTAATLSFTALTLPDLVSFNPRGMPCKYVTGVCTIGGFIYYLTDAAHPEVSTAVSVSPGGRVKQWYWNGTAWVN
jgi:prepilin-type N-terminal cleavage/methylation domain-containing protein